MWAKGSVKKEIYPVQVTWAWVGWLGWYLLDVITRIIALEL